MSKSRVDIVNHLLKTAGATRLIVLLHGFRHGSSNVSGLAALARMSFPDADVYYPDLPYRKWYSTAPMETIAGDLLARISALMLHGHYRDVLFSATVAADCWRERWSWPRGAMPAMSPRQARFPGARKSGDWFSLRR
ncbi:hypothetical protein V5F29_05340 [Xanthobacter aminoxidans]|uniref:hypothetical protein n=1 Tax=Xanthobacter aminoxidans TaxID=186280 RepID=UPI00372CACBA